MAAVSLSIGSDVSNKPKNRGHQGNMPNGTTAASPAHGTASPQVMQTGTKRILCVADIRGKHLPAVTLIGWH